MNYYLQLPTQDQVKLSEPTAKELLDKCSDNIIVLDDTEYSILFKFREYGTKE